MIYCKFGSFVSLIILHLLLFHKWAVRHLCTRISQPVGFLVREPALNRKMVLDQSTQVLHAAIDKVVLRLERLIEVFEDHFDLSRLLLSLICHVARIELPEHVVFALHLAYFGFLSSNLAFGFA